MLCTKIVLRGLQLLVCIALTGNNFWKFSFGDNMILDSNTIFSDYLQQDLESLLYIGKLWQILIVSLLNILNFEELQYETPKCL